MDSMKFIMEQSETAHKHGQNTKIMAWIHSHVQPNESNFMSSVDVHMHRGLEGYFGDVQTIIVGISENKNPDYNIFNLTETGRGRAKKCRSKGFHESCAFKHFFKKVDCEWSEDDFKILDCFKNTEDIEMESNPRQSDESYDEEDSQSDGSDIETDNQTDDDLDQESIQVESSSNESMEDELNKTDNETDIDSDKESVLVELSGDESMENESSDSGDEDTDNHTKSHQGNASSNLETMNLEDIPSINSDHDIDTPINARIVKLETGKLKIQCLVCKTTPNILTHPSKTSKCTVIFSPEDKKMLKQLIAKCKKLQKKLSNQKYYAANPEQKKQQSKDNYAANPEKKKQQSRKKSKDNYAANPEPKKKQSKVNYASNPIPKIEQAKEYSASKYKKDPQQKKQKVKDHYNANPEAQRERKNKENKQKEDSEIKTRFFSKQAQGVCYPCCCCHRMLFKTSVVPFDYDDPDNEVVTSISYNNLHHCITLDDSFKCEDKYWFCHNCKNNLKAGKMPNMCHANNLDVFEWPEELADMTHLELLMIKKKLVFIKIRDKNSSGMKYMKNSIVNVPISDTDLLKSCAFLPRLGDEVGTVNVAFKRKRRKFYYRKPELVRPAKINKALAFLKLNHPSYRKFDMEVLNESSKFMFCHLPLIGQLLEDEKDLLTLDDAYNFLKTSETLTEWLFPVGRRDTESYANLYENLIKEKGLQNKDSFIQALMDQMR